MEKETQPKQTPALKITFEIPDDTPAEKVRELLTQAALRADMTHRTLGGHGLKVTRVETDV